MTTVAVNTNDMVGPVVLPEAGEPIKPEIAAAPYQPSTAERSLGKPTVPLRSASVNSQLRRKDAVHNSTRTERNWMYVHCPTCNTDFPRERCNQNMICPKCDRRDKLMLPGRYNWDNPVISSDDQAADNTSKKLKIVFEN